jgi:hypothetical protein
VRLDAMPTLAGGKPDRTALARKAAELGAAGAALPPGDAGAPGGTGDTAAANGEGRAGTVTPADPMTELLIAGWREVLEHDRIDPSTDFFRAGGHSLLAARLAAWLEPRLGHRPPMRLFFRNPVLADQAGALAATGTAVTATATTSTES